MLINERVMGFMTLSEVMKVLDAQMICGEDMLDHEVETACASDMMSDVLAFSKENTLLLTGLTNPQVLRTADMMDIRCVVFVRGKQPNKEMIDMAREYDVAVLTTKKTLYMAAGALYKSGLMANDE